MIDGSLTILQREITIVTGSATKIYDGLPLQCSKYWISDGSLLPGHILKVGISCTLTDPGTVQNGVDWFSIETADNLLDVSEYYVVTIITGTLKVVASD